MWIPLMVMRYSRCGYDYLECDEILILVYPNPPGPGARDIEDNNLQHGQEWYRVMIDNTESIECSRE